MNMKLDWRKQKLNIERRLKFQKPNYQISKSYWTYILKIEAEGWTNMRRRWNQRTNLMLEGWRIWSLKVKSENESEGWRTNEYEIITKMNQNEHGEGENEPESERTKMKVKTNQHSLKDSWEWRISDQI
jgi:hypothetical protein